MFYLEVKKEFHRYQGDMDWCWEEVAYATSSGEIDLEVEKLFPGSVYRVIEVIWEGVAK